LTTSLATAPAATAQSTEDSVKLVGRVETPNSVSARAWNRTFIVLATFEQGGRDVLVYSIDRASGRSRTHLLPGSDIAYAVVADPRDPNVFWAATSRRAQVFRINIASGNVRKVADLGDDAFIFAMDAAEDGTLFLGTYPQARFYRLSPGSAHVPEEISIPAALTGHRTNVQTVIAPKGDIVFFHLGSPGSLIAFDRQSGKAAEVLRTDSPFLFPARDFPAVIRKVRSVADFRAYPMDVSSRTESEPSLSDTPEWLTRLLPDTEFKVVAHGFSLRLLHDDRTTDLPVRPRHAGMPVVALSQITDRLAIGGTYWNKWAFALDTDKSAIRPLGPIGETGEFFTACAVGREVLIPHYLGQLLMLDPGAAIVADGPKANPREVARLATGHIGLACAELPNGRAVYATLPNYGQENGLVVGYDEKNGLHAISLGRTVSRLAVVGDRLFAASAGFRGLGLRTEEARPRPLVVFELDTRTLKPLRSAAIPVTRFPNATGLIQLTAESLILGVEGEGLFLVDIRRASGLKTRRVGKQCAGVSALTRIGPEKVVAICGADLYAFSASSEGLARIAPLPTGSGYLARGPGGEVFIAAGNSIYRVSASHVNAGMAQAARTPGSVKAISGGDMAGYPAEMVLTRAESAWNSAQVGKVALEKAYIGVDFGANRVFSVAEAELTWVTADTTPELAAIEHSSDGIRWTQITTFKPLPAPKPGATYWSQVIRWKKGAAARYWRIRPASGLAQTFAVEYLEFRL